ncbi:MAG: transglutaminase domain-containing protein [Dehalococcoidales bacterium]|nr:transglutaminase domain-containing protein [Dehalococcoidales bacterium]
MNKQVHILFRIVTLLIIISITALAGLLVYTGYRSISDSCSDQYDAFPDTSFSGIIDKDIDYMSFITPGSPSVQKLAANLTGIEQAYYIANQWLYISEYTLHHAEDRWVLPEEFLSESPFGKYNPAYGEIAGDCEEQANTLASIIRALGVPAEEVRVVLGIVSSGSINRGHVWVEVYHDGYWLPLDPSQGPRWDEYTNSLDIRPGLSFDYYASRVYPVSQVTAYYNDTYYIDAERFMDDAPALWKNDSRQWMLINRE